MKKVHSSFPEFQQPGGRKQIYRKILAIWGNCIGGGHQVDMTPG